MHSNEAIYYWVIKQVIKSVIKYMHIDSYHINFSWSTIISIFLQSDSLVAVKISKTFFLDFCQTSVLPGITEDWYRKCSHVI